uniref:Uncharacterized protein n=1 Tax=Physcomitrium patens TaxID=3218 RepID=A0A2K1K1V6_PHYPA|nr:hypothetical protein PHYPA_012236 [Physcomitrium patens]
MYEMMIISFIGFDNNVVSCKYLIDKVSIAAISSSIFHTNLEDGKNHKNC